MAAAVLPLLGITIGTEALTTTIQVIVAIGTGLWIWIRRVQKGDVRPFGGRIEKPVNY